MTVRFIILFFKRAFIQLLQAERTDKVFRMKFAMHSSDTTTCDWFLAVVTKGTSFRVIVHLTIRFPFVLKETPTREWLVTFLK